MVLYTSHAQCQAWQQQARVSVRDLPKGCTACAEKPEHSPHRVLWDVCLTKDQHCHRIRSQVQTVFRSSMRAMHGESQCQKVSWGQFISKVAVLGLGGYLLKSQTSCTSSENSLLMPWRSSVDKSDSWHPLSSANLTAAPDMWCVSRNGMPAASAHLISACSVLAPPMLNTSLWMWPEAYSCESFGAASLQLELPLHLACLVSRVVFMLPEMRSLPLHVVPQMSAVTCQISATLAQQQSMLPPRSLAIPT